MRRAAALLFVASLTASWPGLTQGTFEVVSIKPNRSGDSGPTFRGGVGRFDAVNATLTEIVRSSFAFTFEDFQVVRGEGWFDSERFDIEARATGQVPARDIATTYVRAMLADRFKVKTHTEQREMPILSIALARADGGLGDGLVASPGACVSGLPTPVPGVRFCGIVIDDDDTGALQLDAHDTTLDLIARRLQFYVKRPVRNDTGLTGRYDVHARFARPVTTDTAERQGDAPSLERAFRDRLGLRLEDRRAPLDVLVIDSASRPDAN